LADRSEVGEVSIADLAQLASFKDESMLSAWLMAQVQFSLLDQGSSAIYFKPNAATRLLSNVEPVSADFALASNLTGRHRVFELIDSMYHVPTGILEDDDEDEDAIDLRRAEERILLPFYRKVLFEQGLIDLDLESGIDVADVGCRNGLTTIAFAQRFPNCRVTGYDNSSGMLTRARDAARQASVFNIRFFDLRERPLEFGPPPPARTQNGQLQSAKFKLILSVNDNVHLNFSEVKKVLSEQDGIWIILHRSSKSPASDLCLSAHHQANLTSKESLAEGLVSVGFSKICAIPEFSTRMGTQEVVCSLFRIGI